jgi:hypothetical protein
MTTILEIPLSSLVIQAIFIGQVPRRPDYRVPPPVTAIALDGPGKESLVPICVPPLVWVGDARDLSVLRGSS